MAINFSSVTLTSNPSNAGANLRISATVTDGNAAKWLMDSSSTYLRDSGGAYLLTTNTSGTSQLNYTATQVNNILANIDAYDDSADLSLYLKTSDAASTYQTISGATSYLPKGTYASSSDTSSYVNANSAYSVYDMYMDVYRDLYNRTQYYDSNILGLPTGTVYISYSANVNPNNFLQGTWERITAQTPFGVSGASGSNSYTLSSANNAYTITTDSITHSYSHSHYFSTWLVFGTTALVTDPGTMPSGTSYYFPYMGSSSSGSFGMSLQSNTGWMSNPSVPGNNNWSSITGSHSHSVTMTSNNTSTNGSISLRQLGYIYYTWRKTSLTNS